MLLNLASATRKAIVTAAEEDNPPIGIVPSITALIPTFNGYFSDSSLVAPRK